MNISADFTRLHRGESGGKILISLSEKYRDKNVRLCFLTPLGRTYCTDSISLDGGEGEFTVTRELTDGRGELLCQLLLGDASDGFLLKSPIRHFHVYAGVDDTSEAFTDGELKAAALSLTEGESSNADYTGLQLSVCG